jgi:hypothetical protein
MLQKRIVERGGNADHACRGKRHNRHHDSLKETDEATALYHAGIRDSLGGYWACRGAAGRR